MEEGNLQFPLHVQTGDEDFIIDREDDATSPDYFASPENGGVRLKRRRRCGQCGPCQVKENCNKCHFCVRRDVLKQTCMYRKCIYLRSKPKPYTRPKETVPSASSSASAVLSPDNSLPENDSGNNTCTSSPFPCQTSTNISERPSSSQNNVNKPVIPQKLPDPYPFSLRPNFPAFDMGMRQLTSPSQMPSVPPAIQTSTLINQHSMVPPGLLDHHSGSLSHSHQMVLPPPSQGVNHLNERSFGDFRGHPMLGLPPKSSQSLSHPLKDSQDFKDMHYPGFSRTNHTQDVSSSCVYPHRPSMTSTAFNTPERQSMFGFPERQPAGPMYFPSDADMFRHLTALPHTYRYPSPRYGQNFGPSPYSRLSNMGMPPPPPPPNLPLHHPVSHPQAWPTFPHQPYSTNCEQNETCSKNGCCPPASQTLGSDTQVMQERYGSIRSFKPPLSPFRGLYFPVGVPLTVDVDQHKQPKRSESVRSNDSGFLSMTSDLECDISIDDCQMNALIRSDGCNNLHIEIDERATDNLNSCFSGKKITKSVEETESLTSKSNETACKTDEEKEGKTPKYTIKGTVYLKQDLGDEGIIQLEIPGNKVFLEDTFLDDKLAEHSSNIQELLEFISKEPQIEYLRNN